MNTQPKPTRLRLIRPLVRIICIFGLAACCTAHAASVTSTWTNAISGNWNVDANWTNVPVVVGSPNFPNNGNGGMASYDAVINTVGPAYTVTLNTNITVEDLFLSSANATLNHTTGVFSATGALSISAGTYRLNGGEISTPPLPSPGAGALPSPAAFSAMGRSSMAT